MQHSDDGILYAIIYTLVMFVFLSLFSKLFGEETPAVLCFVYAIWSGVGYYVGIINKELGKIVLGIFIVVYITGLFVANLFVKFIIDIVMYFSISFYFGSTRHNLKQKNDNERK